MKKNEFPLLNTEYIEHQLAQGLTLLLLPSKKFITTSISLELDYGSAYDGVPINTGRETILFPLGNAHFLEHRIFKGNKIGLFESFSEYGASLNAGTNLFNTTFRFQAYEHIEALLKILFDYVFDYDDEENAISKERSIIRQEIIRSKDDTDSVISEKVYTSAFSSCPLKNPILGTITSLKKINRESLLKAHRLFYLPQRMRLSIVGPIDVDKMITYLEKITPFMDSKPTLPNLKFIHRPEDLNPIEKFSRFVIDYPNERFQLIIKYNSDIKDFKKVIAAKHRLTRFLFFQVWGSSKSFNGHHWLTKGLIDYPIRASHFQFFNQYNFIRIQGYSKKQKMFFEDVKLSLHVPLDKKRDEKIFLSIKKGLLASEIRELDDNESLVSSLLNGYTYGDDLSNRISIINSITIDDLIEYQKTLSQPHSVYFFTLKPRKK